MNIYKAIPLDLVMMIHDNQIKDFGGTAGCFPDSRDRVESTLIFMFETYFGE